MATKQRIEVAPRGIKVRVQRPGAAFADPPVAGVKVVATRAGAVTLLDKLKAYYHTLIVIVGSILVIVNEVTPLLNFLPDGGKQYVSVAIGVLTAVATALKSNEHWVDDL